MKLVALFCPHISVDPHGKVAPEHGQNCPEPVRRPVISEASSEDGPRYMVWDVQLGTEMEAKYHAQFLRIEPEADFHNEDEDRIAVTVHAIGIFMVTVAVIWVLVRWIR